MSGQIIFFKKNLADYDDENVIASASEGSEFASYVQNRNNTSAWITSGSVDANNTTFEIDFAEEKAVTDLIFVKQNWKSYLIEYWDGAAYQAMPTPISVTNNTEVTRRHSFTLLNTQKFRVTIRGTMVANAEKYLYQFIATTVIGQLDGWPVIDEPTHNRNKQSKPMLSGKTNIADNVGGFSFTLKVPDWRNSSDLAIVESLYTANEGFLVWPCGGVATQFTASVIGYRLEDFYLMRPANNYMPEWRQGFYTSGLDLKVKLTESNT